jgi:hypothetical protein
VRPDDAPAIVRVDRLCRAGAALREGRVGPFGAKALVDAQALAYRTLEEALAAPAGEPESGQVVGARARWMAQGEPPLAKREGNVSPPRQLSARKTRARHFFAAREEGVR